MPITGIGRYEPGSNRHRVILNDGRRVSRAEAENIYAQSRGFRSNYERRAAFRAARESRSFDKDYREARQRTGITKTEYTEAYGKLRREYAAKDGDWRQIDKSPDGALAQYLVSIGRRSAGADYTVGESPSI